MKKFLLVALLAAPAIGLTGCKDADTQRDIAQLRTSVAALQAENERLRDSQGGAVIVKDDGSLDAAALLARLERQERELASLRESMAARKPAETTVAKSDEAKPPAPDAEFDARVNAAIERREADQRAREQARQAEQMSEIAEVAKKYDLEFDPNDPRGSMMRIMGNPETRAKAMEAWRTETTERRLAALNLDEFQKQEVLRIENETRTKAMVAAQNMRDSGATQEEVRAEVQKVQQQQKDELARVLTPEQLEEYEKSGAGMGGMIPPGMGDWGNMIPPGMMPGGGGGGGRRGR